ncbi:acyl-CoA dehydrogenase family protein [Microvirga sp. VF16]|uniref:acyl-CoA dehydrogenase family protein n=1 Tax=Microvirga sp. VF16 TaxID=2807101 RepID=UPI00193E846D|nr:acyl-CoA dehydrogenase family protein [Microvirga sp. VF16]QRM30938.1 acyl-CoA dehydrogenase family protein [Microvirga sp. VF16]
MSAATSLFPTDPRTESRNTLHRFASTPVSYEELAERFRPIFKRIAEGAVAREQSRTLAVEPVAWLREAGFGALRIPQVYGGLGASLPQTFRLLIELAEADSNLPQIFRAHFAFVEERLNSKEEADRERWFPLIIDGATFGAAMAEKTEGTETTVTLTKENDRWLLDGYKFYSTGTIYANWIVAVALEGTEYVSLVLPTTAPGVVVEDDWDGFEQRLTGSGTTRFNRVEIRADQILRRLSVEQPPKTSYIIAYYQQFHLAALAGIARAVLKDAIAFTQTKTRTFGVPGKSSPRHDPLVQSVIGRLASLSFTVDSLVESVSASIQEAYEASIKGEDADDFITTANIKAYQAQQIVIEQVLEATTLLFEIGGASAVSETRRLDRYWRNARTLASHNPAVHRARAIGDYWLNGTPPVGVLQAVIQSEAQLKNAAEASARNS